MKKLVLVIISAFSIIGCTSNATSIQEIQAKKTLRIGLEDPLDSWSPFSLRNQGEDKIYSLLQTGLFEYQLSEDNLGYDIINGLASNFPVDVDGANYLFEKPSDDQRLKRGIPAKSEQGGFIYEISINPLAKWEDGKAINANDFVNSLKEFLNPEFRKSGAKSFLSNLEIGNGLQYYKSQFPIFETMGEFHTIDARMDNNLYGSFYYQLPALYDHSFYSLFKEFSNKKLNGTGPLFIEDVDVKKFITLLNNNEWGSVDNPQYVVVKNGSTSTSSREDYIKAIQGLLRGVVKYDENKIYSNYLLADVDSKYSLIKAKYPEMSFEDEVGITLKDNYTFLLWLKNSISEAKLCDILTQSWLQYPNSSNSYNTNVLNTKSYGPYKLVSENNDNYILEKNENWLYFNNLEAFRNGKEIYQASTLNFQVFANHQSALNSFEKGTLDFINLEKEEIPSFKNSKLFNYDLTSATYKLSFNTSWNKLQIAQNKIGVNKTILTNINFRKAFSYALDRNKIVNEYYYDGIPSLVPISKKYVVNRNDRNSENMGVAYRDYPAAQNVIRDVFNNEDGFDVIQAREYLQNAIIQENASSLSGHYEIGDTVEINFEIHENVSKYSSFIKFLEDSLLEIAKTTALENKISIKTHDGLIKNGTTDMAFATWSGTEGNVFNLVTAYINEDELLEYGFQPSVETLTIELDGIEVTKSYTEWKDVLLTGEYANQTLTKRIYLLAAIEKGLVEQFRFISLYTSSRISLNSLKIANRIKESKYYINFSEIKEVEFNYNDTEWEQFISSNNFDLTNVYKNFIK
jgi:hypothetical protein